MTVYTRKVYQQIASKLHAVNNCKESNNREWELNHLDSLHNIANEYLPHGSGIDSGCTIDEQESTPDKIKIDSAFHTMDENGFYCGWIHFSVILTPSLEFDFNLDFTDVQNNSDLDQWESDSLFDYIYQTFDFSLRESLPLI